MCLKTSWMCIRWYGLFWCKLNRNLWTFCISISLTSFHKGPTPWCMELTYAQRTVLFVCLFVFLPQNLAARSRCAQILVKFCFYSDLSAYKKWLPNERGTNAECITSGHVNEWECNKCLKLRSYFLHWNCVALPYWALLRCQDCDVAWKYNSF